jgi:large subunit ribosomal protein L6
VKVTGPKGELTVPVGRGVEVKQDDGSLVVERASDAPEHRAMHGLTRSLLQNAVTGVTDGFTKTLNIAGVGYRAALQGRDINLQVGYSHPVSITPREGIDFEVPQPTVIIVRGIDKQRVGQTAAEIRKVRPPEPYKGKGIRYSDETIRRKVGKAG